MVRPRHLMIIIPGHSHVCRRHLLDPGHVGPGQTHHHRHRGAGHVVTAAVPGAEVGVRAARAGAGGGEVTIGAEAGLTLCVQTRGLQIVKTEEGVWAALTRGHRGHRPVLTSLVAASTKYI